MVTKTRKQDATKGRRKVKVDELKLNKETVKDLSASEQKDIQGGKKGTTYNDWCPSGMEWDGGCATHIYKGGPCGGYSQLDCI